MMKILQLTCFLFFAVSAFSQSQRLVFLEEFTQASCPPCEATTPSLNAAVAANPGKIVQIRYQVWWPGYDPMFLDNEDEVSDRVTYYGVGGVPALFLDGVDEPGNNQTVLPQASVDARYGTSAPIKVEVSHVLAGDLSTADVTVKITNEGTSAYNVATNRLRIAFIEEDITYPYPPGSTSLQVFEAVMKKFITGTAGLEIPSIAAGETWEYTWTEVEVPSTIYDYSKLGVVAFVQDDSDKSIANSGLSEPNAIPVFPDLNVANSSQPSDKYCEYEFVPVATIVNNGNVAIQGFTVIMFNNGEEAGSKSVDAPLAVGASTQVTFDEITLNPGNSSVSFIVNPNSVNDLSVLNNFSVPLAIGKMGDVVSSYANDYENGEVAAYPENTIVTTQANVNFIFTVTNKEFFQATTAVGGKAASEKSLLVNFYQWDHEQTDPNASCIVADQYVVKAGDKLTFDWAYTSYGGSNDRLQIQISEDCGENFTDLFNKSGSGLRTATEVAGGAVFIPKANQWKSSSHDLSAWAGKTVVLRAYVTSEYGNMLYLDNFNVESTSDVNDLTEGEFLNVSPNPAADVANFEFGINTSENVSYTVTDAMGKLVAKKSLGRNNAGNFTHTMDVSDLSNGLYMVKFNIGEREVLKRLMVAH